MARAGWERHVTCRVQMAPMDKTVSLAVSVSTVTSRVTMSTELALAARGTLVTGVKKVSTTSATDELPVSVCLYVQCLRVCCAMHRLQ